MIRTLLVAALFCVVCSSANARPRHGHHRPAQAATVGLPFFGLFEAPQAVSQRPVVRKFRTTQHVEKTHKKLELWENPTIQPMPSGLAKVMAEGAGRVVAHPPGCPARAFCGCGASVERFGRSIRSLWLAANWLRFPRAEPAPGRAAIRRDGHHVVILREHVRGQIWIVYDANSGRHRTRVHPRSIAGFVIVDPSAGA